MKKILLTSLFNKNQQPIVIASNQKSTDIINNQKPKPNVTTNNQKLNIIINIQKLNLLTNIQKSKELKKKILFYGNCQIDAIRKVLNINTNYNVIQCFTSEINENDFKNIIKNSNIIITQPINDNYRNKTYLSTKYIIENCNKDTIIIIFDSCNFNFYYFDLKYQKDKDNNLFRMPSDFHYNELINCYVNKLSPSYYKKNFVDNKNLKTKEDIEKIASDSIEQLLKRNKNCENIYKGNNIYFIGTGKFVKDNYKNKLLFYSTNHPSKYLFQYISERIINILKIDNNINYSCDPLENYKGLIYKCIQQNVNFDINKCIPKVLDKNNTIDIINLYYSQYDKYNLSSKLKIN